MIELRTRKREMRRDGGNHHGNLGLERISCASQYTIPGKAGTCPELTCNITDTTCSQSNQATCTCDFSYPLVSSALSLSSSPISLFLVHNSTIITEHKVQSLLSISLCHNHEVTPSTAYTENSIQWVQHTLSTTYTEVSIHRVQHTSSTASTQDCLSCLHSDDFELTPECSFSFQRASLSDRPPSASSQWELKGEVTFSHSNGCEFTTWWQGSQHLGRCPSTASKHSSKHARLRRRSSHHYGLQVQLRTRSIMASKLTWSRPPSVSPNSLNYGLKVYLQTRSTTASKLAQSRPRSASLCSLNHGLDMYLQLHSIVFSKCISKLAYSRPLANLWVHSIIIFRRTSNCSEAQSADSADILCVDG